MTWVLKAASACGVWALTIPFGVVLLVWVAVEEIRDTMRRRRRERQFARQVERERASW